MNAVERSVLEANLAELDQALADSPAAADLRFARAYVLDTLGRAAEAIAGYRAVLAVDAAHLDALTGLAALLARAGDGRGAREALLEGLRLRPDDANAHANVAILLSDDDPDAAIAHYRRAAELEPGHRNAHRGLAILLLRRGDLAAAREHGQQGFTGEAESWPYRGGSTPVSLLVIHSALGGNIPIDGLLDDTVFEKHTLVAEFAKPDAVLPPHDVVLNAIGDADKCGVGLDMATRILAGSSVPVLNRPEKVRDTGRAANAAALALIPGVTVAKTEAWPRARLTSSDAAAQLAQAGFAFPVLVRAPGFQTGQHFVRVESPGELSAAVQGLPGEALFLIQFVETAGADGTRRKYRVMMIDGELYPLHLAVATGWKVHYFSADMAANAAHRAEDEAFLADMPGVLGQSVMEALRRIQAHLGLDYGGIDFALDRRGNVLVFESNATMAIVPPGPEEHWRYRWPAVERARDAVRRMLVRPLGRRP